MGFTVYSLRFTVYGPPRTQIPAPASPNLLQRRELLQVGGGKSGHDDLRPCAPTVRENAAWGERGVADVERYPRSPAPPPGRRSYPPSPPHRQPAAPHGVHGLRFTVYGPPRTQIPAPAPPDGRIRREMLQVGGGESGHDDLRPCAPTVRENAAWGERGVADVERYPRYHPAEQAADPARIPLTPARRRLRLGPLRARLHGKRKTQNRPPTSDPFPPHRPSAAPRPPSACEAYCPLKSDNYQLPTSHARKRGRKEVGRGGYLAGRRDDAHGSRGRLPAGRSRPISRSQTGEPWRASVPASRAGRGGEIVA